MNTIAEYAAQVPDLYLGFFAFTALLVLALTYGALEEAYYDRRARNNDQEGTR